MTLTAVRFALQLMSTLALCATSTAAAAGDWTVNLGIPEPMHYFGDGTFYGRDQDDAGACSYGPAFSNSLGLSWSQGIDTYVAMNAAQYEGGLACGLCLMYRGSPQGDGLGTPILGNWTMAMVDNQCPECAYGSLDLALAGNGRWKVEWYPVECMPGVGTFRYDVGGSPNPYWFEFTVSNTRVPIQNVEYQQNGYWYGFRRTFPDNHWALNGGPFTFPMNIRLTSVRNDTVHDVLQSEFGGQGRAQFPSHSSTLQGAAASPSPGIVSPGLAAAASPSSDVGAADAAAGRRMLMLRW